MSKIQTIDELRTAINKSVKGIKAGKIITSIFYCLGGITFGALLAHSCNHNSSATSSTIPIGVIIGVFVFSALSFGLNFFFGTTKDYKASSMAKKFFLEKSRTGMEEFFKDLGFSYKYVDVIKEYDDDEIFAEFSSGKLEFYLSWESPENEEKSLSEHPQNQSGETIVVNEYKIIETKDGDCLVIDYKLFAPTSTDKKGSVAQKFLYRVPLSQLS
jgi:hypothetical protein